MIEASHKINEFLRSEYKAFQILLHKAELDTESVPVNALMDIKYVLDHLMRASEVEEAETEIKRAHNHLNRSARDIYFHILSARLDRLKELPKHIRNSADLDRFREEYIRIKTIVEETRSDIDKANTIQEYIQSLSEIDSMLESFSGLESEIIMKKGIKIARYKNILIALLSGLIGAVIASLLMHMLFK